MAPDGNGEKAVNRAISMTPSLWAQVDAAAADAGMPRSTFVAHVLQAHLAGGQPARGAHPARRATSAPQNPGSCPHPVNRRIGDRCGLCGNAVKAGR